MDNTVGKYPSRTLRINDKVVECAEIRAGADRGYVFDPLIHDRVRKYRSTLKGDVVPSDSWQNENCLRDLVDWEPVEEALRPEGLMVARAAMMSNKTPRGQAAD